MNELTHLVPVLIHFNVSQSSATQNGLKNERLTHFRLMFPFYLN